MCATPSFRVLSFYIYKREIQAAFSGILTPNAAVLIAIFAFRLSAGGVSVMFARSDGQRGRRK